jgi:L-asparaginase/Glu-tRNA(Gln) amidotransferase subunit D
MLCFKNSVVHLLVPHSGKVIASADLTKSVATEAQTFTSLTQEVNGQYDSRYITKLRKNYRSHPKILELPNKLFYKVWAFFEF